MLTFSTNLMYRTPLVKVQYLVSLLNYRTYLAVFQPMTAKSRAIAFVGLAGGEGSNQGKAQQGYHNNAGDMLYLLTHTY